MISLNLWMFIERPPITSISINDSEENGAWRTTATKHDWLLAADAKSAIWCKLFNALQGLSNSRRPAAQLLRLLRQSRNC